MGNIRSRSQSARRGAIALSALLIATALAGPAGANPETSGPAAGGPPAGMTSVIVNLHEPAGWPATRAVTALGGEVRQRFRLIDALSAHVPEQAIAALEANPLVESVEVDHRIVAFQHGPNTGDPELEASWGVEHIGAGEVHAAGNTGQGIKVGVIDTGVDYTHPELAGRYAGGYDIFNDDADPFDDHGHGTHVSGSLLGERGNGGVVGVAPGASLYAYKVLSGTGEGEYSHLIAALERATLVDEVDVVNMSLGGKEPSAALQAAVEAAYAEGVVLVAASGNVNPFDIWELFYGCPVAYPARYDQVMATTFTGQSDELTGYSCTGPEIDFASPGDLIYSSVPSGTCPMCAASGYSTASGTSMASPHLAGTVALVLAHGITNGGDAGTLADDVKGHLCANASVGFGVLTTPISTDDPRYAQYFGCGVVDADGALLSNPPPGGDPGPSPTPTAPAAPTPTATATATASPTPTATPTAAPTPTATPTAAPTPTPTPTANPTLAPALHVGDLDASYSNQGRQWVAKVTVTVHSAAEARLSGASVTGTWSNGGTASCSTKGGGQAGTCTLQSGKLASSLGSVALTISSVTLNGYSYEPAQNHDPDGDSDGISIVVTR